MREDILIMKIEKGFLFFEIVLNLIVINFKNEILIYNEINNKKNKV